MKISDMMITSVISLILSVFFYFSALQALERAEARAVQQEGGKHGTPTRNRSDTLHRNTDGMCGGTWDVRIPGRGNT